MHKQAKTFTCQLKKNKNLNWTNKQTKTKVSAGYLNKILFSLLALKSICKADFPQLLSDGIIGKHMSLIVTMET